MRLSDISDFQWKRAITMFLVVIFILNGAVEIVASVEGYLQNKHWLLFITVPTALISIFFGALALRRYDNLMKGK